MSHRYFALSARGMIVVGCAFLASTNGCEKVPTFQELTQQQQATPANPAPVETVKSAPAVQPGAPVQVAPVVDDPQKVISDFKNKPSYQRNDQDLARLGSLTSGLDAITDMDLRTSTATDDGFKHLAKMTNLESIQFGNTKVTNIGLSAVLELPKLTSLNLAGCTVTVPMMETLSKLENLEVLSLEGNKVGDTELSALVNLPKLKDLNLVNCPISDSSFKALGTLKHLEILKVDGTLINGSGMQFMKRKKAETGLRVLSAQRTRFGEQGLQLLRGVETLEELDIGQSQVSDQTLAFLKGVTHLKKLSLSYNAITDNGAKVLSGIRSLEHLSLGGCQRISDVTLSNLKGNKELRVLDLNGSGNVTLNGGKALKKFLPECEITILGTKL